MKLSLGLRAVGRRFLPFLLAAAAVALVFSPVGLGFSAGIHKDKAGVPGDFEQIGCASCHGESHKFTPTAVGQISWALVNKETEQGVAGNAYEHGATYTITITLQETNAQEADNHAGFNLRASAGKLAGVEGVSQVSGDGSQATHMDASRTNWTVEWTAPDEGVVVFDLFVNDVDGSRAQDAKDEVHRVGWYLTDESHALPGAQAEEAVEFGITLQQYWIGLIGLLGMVVVMVAGFAYLKFANPHNTDAKDR